jgi:hypothetical protein
MKTTTIKLALFIIGICLATNLLAQEKFSLEYKYLKGKTYKYKSSVNFVTMQEMAGQEMKVSGTSESVSRYLIENVAPNGDVTMVFSFDEMVVSTKMPGVDTTMIQNEIIGKRTRYVLSKSGKIVSTTAIDSIKTALADLGMDMGAGSMQKFTELPEHQLVTGGKWVVKRTDTVNIGGGDMINQTQLEYTLSGKEMKNNHNCLKIEYTAKSEINGKMKQMGMDMFIEGTGTTKGSIWFDQALGIWIFDESDLDMDMTIAMTGQMAMTIPMTQKIKTVQHIID